MFQSLRIGVVIPAYSEEAHIEGVVRMLPPWVDHIVVVDDASPDRTGERAQGVGDPRVVVMRLDRNQGVGGATLAGFRKAAELGADVLVKMDGDGQMDPSGLPALLGPIQRGEADYVKGNRFLHARALTKMPFVRRLGNVGLSFMAKLASGYWGIFDPNNGYVALHARVFRLLDTSHIDPRFFFENGMLLELGIHRAVVRDVYMPARYEDEISHLSVTKTLCEFPWRLLRGFLRRFFVQYIVRDFNAVSLFVLSGIVLCGFGSVWGGYHWYLSVSTRVAATTGTVMIAVLPIIVGIQLLLQAMVMDIENAPREPIHPQRPATE